MYENSKLLPLEQAAQKGCDAVDPMVDGYSNNTDLLSTTMISCISITPPLLKSLMVLGSL